MKISISLTAAEAAACIEYKEAFNKAFNIKKEEANTPPPGVNINNKEDEDGNVLVELSVKEGLVILRLQALKRLSIRSAGLINSLKSFMGGAVKDFVKEMKAIDKLA